MAGSQYAQLQAQQLYLPHGQISLDNLSEFC